MQKQRLLQFDILRIFACMLVLTFHFNSSVAGYDKFLAFVYPDNFLISNIYFVNFWLGLFFLLTGSCLQYTYGTINLNIRDILYFYKRRAKSLFPIFYVTWFLLTLFSFLYYKSYPQITVYDCIATLFGMDAYIMLFTKKMAATYQCGEWFLGCIVCLYVIYPLISFAANKFPKITGLLIFAAYAFVIKTGIVDEWFFLQIPYLYLGIMFVKYFNYVHSWKICLLTAVVFILRLVFSNYLPVHTLRLINCWCLFLLVSLLVEKIGLYFDFFKNKALVNIISYCSILTYPMFLCHHKIVRVLTEQFDLANFPYRYVVLLFLAFMTITVLFSIFTLKLTRTILNLFKESAA